MKTLEIGELESGLRACLAGMRDGEEVMVRDGETPVAWVVKMAPYESLAKIEEEVRLRPVVEPAVIRGNGKIDVDRLLRYKRGEVSKEAMMEALDWAKGEY